MYRKQHYQLPDQLHCFLELKIYYPRHLKLFDVYLVNFCY